MKAPPTSINSYRCEVLQSEELFDLLRELRSAFPDTILDFDVIEISKEHKLNHLPPGVLDNYTPSGS